MQLSSVILAKNEEGNIKDAISSVNFADEVIVVDDFSTDETVKIAQECGAKVYQRDLKGGFSSQRNFGLEKAKDGWVLFVDADERVTEELKREITQLINNSKNEKYNGFYLKRKNLFLGKVVGEDKVLRLAKKDAGKWQRIVHEVWKVKGKVGKLDGYLVHATAGSLKEAISKTNFYSSLHAKQNTKDGKRSNLFRIILFPKAKFLQNIITGRGFVFGLVHAFHSYLAWSKQWLLQRNLAKNQ